MNTARSILLRAACLMAAALFLLPSATAAQPERVRVYDGVPGRVHPGRVHDACWYYGRCTADELQRLRDRLQRIDRVTPQAPEPESPGMTQPLTNVEPTPVENIRPEYRNTSQLREEYRDKPAKAKAPDEND